MATNFDALAPIFAAFKPAVEDANKIAEEYRAATSTDKEAMADLINTSEDETIVALRADLEKIAAAEAKIREKKADADKKIREHARALLTGGTGDYDAEGQKKVYLEKRQIVASMAKTLELMLGGDKEAFAAAKEHFGIKEVIGLSRTATGSPSGQKKPRISAATVDGEDVADSEGKVSFTLVAKKIGANVGEIREAAFKSAGGDEFSEGQVIDFTFVNGDKTHNVSVTAKGMASAK